MKRPLRSLTAKQIAALKVLYSFDPVPLVVSCFVEGQYLSARGWAHEGTLRALRDRELITRPSVYDPKREASVHLCALTKEGRDEIEARLLLSGGAA